MKRLRVAPPASRWDTKLPQYNKGNRHRRWTNRQKTHIVVWYTKSPHQLIDSILVTQFINLNLYMMPSLLLTLHLCWYQLTAALSLTQEVVTWVHWSVTVNLYTARPIHHEVVSSCKRLSTSIQSDFFIMMGLFLHPPGMVRSLLLTSWYTKLSGATVIYSKEFSLYCIAWFTWRINPWWWLVMINLLSHSPVTLTAFNDIIISGRLDISFILYCAGKYHNF